MPPNQLVDALGNERAEKVRQYRIKEQKTSDRIGFDEGPKPNDWPHVLEARGIAVLRDIARSDAVAVLKHYVDRGGTVYNPRQSVDP